MKKEYLIPSAIIVTGLLIAIFGGGESPTGRLGLGVSEPKCTASSSRATLGNGASQRILATSGIRAWASIQQPVNATNTVHLSFAQDEPAVIGEGRLLTIGDSTSSVSSIEFGRNTFLPYTGSVSAITDLDDATVLITECNY